jgi:hypothetical protein
MTRWTISHALFAPGAQSAGIIQILWVVTSPPAAAIDLYRHLAWQKLDRRGDTLRLGKSLDPLP